MGSDGLLLVDFGLFFKPLAEPPAKIRVQRPGFGLPLPCRLNRAVRQTAPVAEQQRFRGKEPYPSHRILGISSRDFTV
jgi:hypothetical protein